MSHFNGRDRRVRNLHKKLGEYDAACSFVAVACNSFEDEIADEQDRKSRLATEAKKYDVVLHNIDQQKAKSSVNGALIVGVNSIFEEFLKRDIIGHEKFTKEKKRDKESNFDFVIRNYNELNCEKYYILTIKYYREIRNKYVHIDKKRKGKSKELDAIKECSIDIKTQIGGRLIPNSIENLDYWDTNIYTRSVKKFAEAICNQVRFTNNEIAEKIESNLGRLKRLNSESPRFEQALAGKIQHEFGVDENNCSDIISIVKRVLA